MIVAVVLAAGRSKRMGKAKQTLLIRGKPMLQRVLDVYRRTRAGKIVVVLGADAEKVSRSVIFDEEEVVYNPDYGEGMSSSLRVGIAAAGPRAEAVIVALSDQPFVSPATINRLIKSYQSSRSKVVVPVYRGARGNPVLLDRSLFPEIGRIRGDLGAKSVVGQNEDSLLEVPVIDKGVIADIDTPEQYQAASRSRATGTRAGR